jgi:hypothetical protein
MLHLLPEDRRARRDDRHLAPILEILQVPAERGGIFDEPVRRDLKGDDHPGLVEVARAPIDELDA